MQPNDQHDVIGHELFAATGERLGRVDSVYLDAASGLRFAALATTTRGRRRLMFVPLAGSSIDEKSVKVRCGAELARRAPRTKLGHGPAECEAELYRHYELLYTPRDDGTTRLRLSDDGGHRTANG